MTHIEQIHNSTTVAGVAVDLFIPIGGHDVVQVDIGLGGPSALFQLFEQPSGFILFNANFPVGGQVHAAFGVPFAALDFIATITTSPVRAVGWPMVPLGVRITLAANPGSFLGISVWSLDYDHKNP